MVENEFLLKVARGSEAEFYDVEKDIMKGLAGCKAGKKRPMIKNIISAVDKLKVHQNLVTLMGTYFDNLNEEEVDLLLETREEMFKLTSALNYIIDDADNALENLDINWVLGQVAYVDFLIRQMTF